MSLISVIIPLYNSEKTIRETIESVLKQTFTDFELIVINDGSKDGSLQIVQPIQDPRLKVFSYPNAGVSVSRNRGVSHATGGFIAFLDADDLWTPDKLEAQLRALQENPQAAVAYSWTDYIDESSRFLYPGSHTTLTGNIYEKLLVHNFIENGSNTLIRKQALTEVGGFDESLTTAADWDLFLRLAARFHFVAVPSPQILYRLSASSMSSNVSKQEAEMLKVIKRNFNQAPESLHHLKKYSTANLYKYLTFKVLAGSLERQKGISAARLLWHCLRNNPSLLRQHPKLMLIVLIKIAAVVLLPEQQFQMLFSTAKSLNRPAHT